MKNKILEMGKHFLTYGVGGILQGLVGFLLLPLLSHYYDPNIYGEYALIILIGTLLSSLFFLGSSSALTRFYFDKIDETYRQKVFLNSFIIVVFGGFLQIMFGILFSKKLAINVLSNPEYELPILLYIIGSAISFTNTFLLTYIRTKKLSRLFVTVSIINFLINFFVTFILLYFKFLSEIIYAPIIGFLSGNFLILIVLFFYIPNGLKWEFFEKKYVYLYLLFGLPTIINGFLYYLIDWIDRYFIKYFYSVQEVGIYSFGYKIGMLIQPIFIIPFGMIWATIRMEYFKDKNTRHFFSLTTTYFTIIGLCISLILTLFSKELIHVFTDNPEYYDSYTVIPWILFGHLFFGYINILDFGIYYEKKVYHYVWIFAVGLIINFILNLIFIPIFGYIASAIITTITYFIISLLIYFVGNYYYKFPIETKRMTRLFLSSIILIIISLFIKMDNIYLYKSLLFICIITYWLLYVLNKSERKNIYALITQLITINKKK